MRLFNGLAFCSPLQLHPVVPRNLEGRAPSGSALRPLVPEKGTPRAVPSNSTVQ